MIVVQETVMMGAIAAEIFALVLVWKRHGIPNAPAWVTPPLAISMPAVVVAWLALLWIMLPATSRIFLGMGWEFWVTLEAGGHLVTFASLCVYTGWWHFVGRHRVASRMRLEDDRMRKRGDQERRDADREHKQQLDAAEQRASEREQRINEADDARDAADAERREDYEKWRQEAEDKRDGE